MKKIKIILIVFVILFVVFMVTIALGQFRDSKPAIKFDSLPQVKAVNSGVDGDRLFNVIQEWKGDEAYKENEHTCTMAQTRLEETVENWSHDGFSAGRFCTSYCSIGENLARGFNSEEEVLQAWLDSSLHRRNLEFDYRYSCIKTDGDYIVHIFAKYK